jgi:hypothetical protein
VVSAGLAVAAPHRPSQPRLPELVHPAAATRRLKPRATPEATFRDTAPEVIERKKGIEKVRAIVLCYALTNNILQGHRLANA